MKNIFRKIGIFIENRHLLVIIMCLLLVAPAIYGASKIKMASGNDTFISPDSQVYQDYTRFNQNFSSYVIVVLVEADDLNKLLTPGNMKAMESVEDRMGATDGVISAVGPAFFIKQAMQQQGGSAQLPADPESVRALVTDPDTGMPRAAFANVFPDQQHAMIAITIDGRIPVDSMQPLVEDVQVAVKDAGFNGVNPIVTGQPVMFGEINQSMGKSLGSMMVAAIILMLVILALIFKVRNFFAWRWLPLGIVAIAIIYTFGVMGVLDIPMTMVTMAAFPVLIGLGVDYAIQFHNRYDEESRRGETVAEAIIDSITHIGPAIGIAIITACLGFTALFFSPIPMIKDFGYTLIIGVAASYLLAMFLLMAILYWHDRRSNHIGERASVNKNNIGGNHGTSSGSTGMVERSLRRLAPGVIGRPLIIIPIALVLCLIGLAMDGRIGTEPDVMKFISNDVPAFRDMRKLEVVAGGGSTASIFIEAADVTDPKVLAWMAASEERIRVEQADSITSVNSIADFVKQAEGGELPQDAATIRQIVEKMPLPVKRNLINDKYTAANLVVSVGPLDSNQIKVLNQQLSSHFDSTPAGASAVVTGSTIVQDKVVSGLTEGREKMTFIGVVFVFAGLLLLFRLNAVKALLAILPIGLIIGWSAIVMYLLGIVYTPVTATLGALVIGIGVEFTVLLMARYYEEREKGEKPEEAMTTAMTKIGRAIIASGLTVVAGFGALLIARDFPILQDLGVVTMVNVIFTLVSTLIVLPPLIVAVDTRVSRKQEPQAVEER